MRTITVKGTGKVQVPVDWIELSLKLETTAPDYPAMMAQAAQRQNALQTSVQQLGFSDTDLKTLSYRVRTVTRSVRDAEGDYRDVFVGYCCTHAFRLSFAFRTERLSQVLSALGSCPAKPTLDITFTVQDPDAVKEALLQDCARNARRKAEILAQASGVALGQLVSIQYDWMDLEFHSQSRWEDETDYFSCTMNMLNPRITPDDISTSDNAAFVWELV